MFHFFIFQIFLFFLNFFSKYVPLPACGAPWRCGVLTTQGGETGIGMGHLLGREHDSSPQSEVEAPRLLKRSFSRLFLTRATEEQCIWPQSTELHRRSLRLIGGRSPGSQDPATSEPSTTHKCESSRAQKLLSRNALTANK